MSVVGVHKERTAPFAAVLILAALLGAVGPSVVMAQATVSENKQIVVDFYRTVFVDKRVREGFEKYVVESYVQHNPLVPTGREAAVKLLSERLGPQGTAEIKRVIAEGDLVVLHAHSRSNPEDRGRAIVDIFRVVNGKIVEHWDVIQRVPETAANNNTMF
jgi:predicted SnoaL-like aldol condensation-catalyzing enzyme